MAENYFDYIARFPYYIHTNAKNLNNTAKTIYEKRFTTEDLEGSIETNKDLNDAITYQEQRENEILSKLGLKDEEDLVNLFERLGFIEKKGLEQKLVQKLKSITESEGYLEQLDIRYGRNKYKGIEVSKDSLNNIKEDIERIFENEKRDIDKIVKEMLEIIEEYESTSENENKISRRVLDKLNEFRNKNFDKTTEDYPSLLYDHIRTLQGKISTYYQMVMEDIKDANTQLISKNEKHKQFEILQQMDTYRKKIEGAYSRAKADKMIVEYIGEIEYPVGGITAKKATPIKNKNKETIGYSIKLHDTTSIDSFINFIKRYGGYIKNKDELNFDLLIMRYLLTNITFYSGKGNGIDDAALDLKNFAQKYSYVFLANGIFREIYNKEINNDNYQDLKKIFSYEHADFTFIIKENETKISRLSEELKMIRDNGKISLISNFGDSKDSKKIADVKSELIGEKNAKSPKLWKELNDLKSQTIKQFNGENQYYDNMLSNNLLLEKMIYASELMTGALSIRVDLRGV